MRENEFFKRGLIVGLAVSTLMVTVPPAVEVQAETKGNAYYELSSRSVYSYKGTTGHKTNISIMNKEDYEILAPDKVITDITVPINYVNPWYSKGSSDGAKAVKNYYYLGTVMYNDTKVSSSSASGGYNSLSEEEQQNYDDLKDTYKAKLNRNKQEGQSASLAKANAEAALLEQGIRYGSKDLPLIFELITGDKFDYQHWYNEGINGIEDYAHYKSNGTSASSIKQGKISDYAKSIKVSDYDTKIAQPYAVVVNGEARLYVKALKVGSTTMVVNVTTNNNEKFSYRVKISASNEGTSVKYKEEVNPLSYEGYCINSDSISWLSYVTTNGDFFKTKSDSIIKTSGSKVYKDNHYDKSEYLKEYLQNIGAYEKLENGSSEFEVYSMVMDAINNDRFKYEDDGRYSGNSKVISWCSLEQYLEGGCEIDCSGHSNIMCGIAECLGLNWFNVTSTDHIEPYIVLDGEIYFNNASFLFDVVKVDNSICAGEVSNSNSSVINYTTLNEIANQKYKNKFNTFLYKLNDKYTAGGFKMGHGEYIDIDELELLRKDMGDTRLITVISDYDASESPFWDKDSNYAVTLQYSVPYVQKAYFSKISKGSTKQIQLVNSEWSDWVVKSGNSSIMTVSSDGKFTMKGTGTAMITLSSKSIKGLAIKVIVSTEKLNSSATASKVGTYYNGDTVLAGDYVRQ